MISRTHLTPCRTCLRTSNKEGRKAAKSRAGRRYFERRQVLFVQRRVIISVICHCACRAGLLRTPMATASGPLAIRSNPAYRAWGLWPSPTIGRWKNAQRVDGSRLTSGRACVCAARTSSAAAHPFAPARNNDGAVMGGPCAVRTMTGKLADDMQ